MIEFILNNKSDLLLVLTSIVTVASVIVKLTPSKFDDLWLNKILKLLAINK